MYRSLECCLYDRNINGDVSAPLAGYGAVVGVILGDIETGLIMGRGCVGVWDLAFHLSVLCRPWL